MSPVVYRALGAALAWFINRAHERKQTARLVAKHDGATEEWARQLPALK